MHAIPVAKSSRPAARHHAPSDDTADQGAGFGFPKSAHLLKHADFDRVYRNGRRISQPDFVAFYLRNDETQAHLRIGFTVGRVLGGAVDRNRIRRRLREVVRLNLPAIGSGLAADLVLQPRKSALTADFALLHRQIAETLAAVRQNRGTLRPARSAAGSNHQEQPGAGKRAAEGRRDKKK